MNEFNECGSGCVTSAVCCSLLETLTPALAAVWCGRAVIGTCLRDRAVAPVMGRTIELGFGLRGGLVSQRRDEHGFRAQMFAENRLAHIQVFNCAKLRRMRVRAIWIL